MLKKCISLLLVSFMALAMSLPVLAADLAGWSDKPSAWAQADIAQAVSLGLIPDEMQSAYNKPTTRQEFCQL